MSWSFGATIPADADETQAARMLEEEMTGAGQINEFSPEARHQAQEAVNQAAKIIGSGCLGHLPIAVYLSGHANAGHTPTEGWSDDALSMVFNQMSEGSVAV
ncbi:MAG TPA: hypothetical protein VMV23_05460 [Candidatus Nanopelagicaceae bacterium]|nr:hypothetical protein [Candidatus Nanopelagicaceae bacterium]